MSPQGRLLAVFSILLTLTVGCDSGSVPGCFPARIAPRGTAPDFELSTLENPKNTVRLSEVYAENPVLLIFWATWCPPCVEEIPLLNEWHERYQGRGLKILGVNVQERREELLDFRKKFPIDYPVVLDAEGALISSYGLVGLPVSVFVAKGGEILYYGFGLPVNIEELLAKGGAPQARKEIPE